MRDGQGASPARTDALRRVCIRYLEAVSSPTPGAAAELFAEDATLEDPVGARPYRGRATIREFYARNARDVSLRLAGPLIVCGHEAAMMLEASVVRDGTDTHIEVIDVLEFDAHDAITRLRAFVVPPFEAT